MRTVGIEEEYLLLDAQGTPVASSGAAIKAITPTPRPPGTTAPSTVGPGVERELTQQQLESGTRPRTGLDEVLDEVRHARARAQQAAHGAGARIAALGTSPVAVEPTTSPDPRYEELIRRFALTAREQLTCGCHIHVGVDSDEEGVQVLDRIGPWLPVLLALSSNSPFWHGADSGYASYRSQVWNRWPSAGPTAQFGSAAAYHGAVEDLVSTGTILDTGMVYFDARLSAHYPTVEIRVADVCLDAEDAVLVAALARGLVDTAATDWARGRPAPAVRVEQLRAATWRAARSGLRGELVSPSSLRPVTAQQAVTELVDHVAGALDSCGDLDRVRERLAHLLAGGTGAEQQVRWLAESDLYGVADRAARRTVA